eukprot:8425916-Prorocentrum_lima.AAC.1
MVRIGSVHFPRSPELTIVVDVHEPSDMPTLLSLPQMTNLGFRVGMKIGAVYRACPSSGYGIEELSF